MFATAFFRLARPQPFLVQSRSVVQSRFAKKANDVAEKLPFKVGNVTVVVYRGFFHYLKRHVHSISVYVKIRAHGTLVYTVVRRIYGDVEAMKQQLRILCESPVRERIGSLEVHGLHVKKIKKWLVQCG